MHIRLATTTRGRRIATVLVVCAFLSSSAFAEVLNGALGLSESLDSYWINLETGETFFQCGSRRCLPVPPEYDFRFSLSIGLPVLVHNIQTPASVRRIAIFDEQPFESIGVSDIATATFSTGFSNFPLESDDTVILQTDSGAYYRIGNFVLSGLTNVVSFNYEDLTGDIDTDRIFRNSFEAP